MAACKYGHQEITVFKLCELRKQHWHQFMIMKEKKKYFASQVCTSLMKRIEMKSHFQGKLPITAVAPKVAPEKNSNMNYYHKCPHLN